MYATALILAFLAADPTPNAMADEAWPAEHWSAADPEAVGLDRNMLEKARDYALTGEGSGFISRGGRVVLTWGDLDHRYDLKSSTKAIGVTALGLAIADGKIDLKEKARKYHPNLGLPREGDAPADWLDRITILQLATQTAGFAKPGGTSELLFEPGTAWYYSDSGPNWLAECITLAYRRDVKDLLFDRVFTPLGIQPDDLTWRKNAYRPAEIDGIPRREFGSGISANVDAMARIGLLYLREGRWKDQQILPRSFVDAARTTVPGAAGLPEHDAEAEHGNASEHYGLLWWNNADGTLPDLPRDAYWSWGLYDSLIVVIPSLDLVVSRAGKSWARHEGGGHYDVLQPFLGPIAASVRTAAPRASAPYPPSRAIVGIDWSPASTIQRSAPGSDNWPLTWTDEDVLMTAYGDGRGFRPFVPRKLSLGLAKVVGPPDDFQGVNLPAPTLDQLGDGAKGRKASGILCVDGVLSLWARNADNAQLAWSKDHGQTWTWADWRLETSFGCPTFLNFGRDYAGARDEFVYVYSHDSASAYEAADRMVLARVPKDRINDRSSYTFFNGLDSSGAPRWSPDITRRAAVFEHPGHCYRSTITHNPALGRYLWVQTLPGPDARFHGGFGIYDAPEPWGPWTTIFLTDDWDVGPGETASLPTKWISDDGQSAHLVFSGDDAFSVRRLRFLVPGGHR